MRWACLPLLWITKVSAWGITPQQRMRHGDYLKGRGVDSGGDRNTLSAVGIKTALPRLEKCSVHSLQIPGDLKIPQHGTLARCKKGACIAIVCYLICISPLMTPEQLLPDLESGQEAQQARGYPAFG